MLLNTRLKELRKENNLNQNELAKLCNVQQSCISKWERGITSPSTDMIVCLAKIFDVSCDYLLGKDEI